MAARAMICRVPKHAQPSLPSTIATPSTHASISMLLPFSVASAKAGIVGNVVVAGGTGAEWAGMAERTETGTV